MYRFFDRAGTRKTKSRTPWPGFLLGHPAGRSGLRLAAGTHAAQALALRVGLAGGSLPPRLSSSQASVALSSRGALPWLQHRPCRVNGPERRPCIHPDFPLDPAHFHRRERPFMALRAARKRMKIQRLVQILGLHFRVSTPPKQSALFSLAFCCRA